jgi:hypothetical protein
MSTEGLKAYWGGFNKQTSYEVGDRNDHYNDVLSIFVTPRNPDLKARIQVVNDYKKSKELHINLILSTKLPQNLDALKNEMSGYEQKFENFKLRDIRGTNPKSLTAMLYIIPLLDLGDLKDPQTYSNQGNHFDWFDDNLKKIQAAL